MAGRCAKRESNRIDQHAQQLAWLQLYYTILHLYSVAS